MFRSIFQLLTNKIYISVSNIIFTFSLIILLSANDYGILVIALAWLNLSCRLLSFGGTATLQYYASKGIKSKVTLSLIKMLVPHIIFSCIFTIIIIFYGSKFIINASAYETISSLIIFLPLIVFHFNTTFIFIGKHFFRLYFLSSASPYLIGLFFIWIINFFEDSFSLTNAISSWQIIYVTGFILVVIAIIASSFYERSMPLFPDLNLKKFLNYSLSSYINIVINKGYFYVGIIISSTYLPVIDVANYGFLRLFGEGFIFIYGAFGAIVMNLSARSELNLLQLGKYLRGMSILLMTILPLILLAYFFVNNYILAEKFSGSFTLALLIIIGNYFNILQRSLENFIYGKGMQTLLIPVSLISILIYVVSIFATENIFGLSLQNFTLLTSLYLFIQFLLTLLATKRIEAFNAVELFFPQREDFNDLVVQFIKIKNKIVT